MKISGIAFIFFILLFTQHTFAQVKDTLLAKRLNEMALQDQQIQEDFIKATTDSARQAISLRNRKIFDTNCNQLKTILDKHGYPGIDRVGKQGSYHFWLLVQHCDSDVKFQESVLQLMEKQVKKNNVDKANYAYLVDRVRINQGQPQVYGTQMEVKDILAGYSPKPISQPEEVNKRRQEMGLGTLEEYLKKMNDMFYTMNKDKIEKEKQSRQQKKGH